MRRWKLFIPTAAGVVVVLLATVWFLQFHRAQALTESDSILLGDFVNTTGDPVFEGTLKQALAVKLQESPFLNIVSEQQVRDTLRLMGRSPDERVIGPIAREICERQNIKAMLTGSISTLGSHYVIALDALNCRTGDSLAKEQEEANSKEEVLGVLGKAVPRLRGKLGESLASVQKYDVPLTQATTSSLEALKAFTQGRAKIAATGSYPDAIPFLKRALELDSNFALAYVTLGLAYQNLGEHELGVENLKKAFELRDRVSERERFSISAFYYRTVTGEYHKAIETFQLWTQSYPREWSARNSLGVTYSRLGQFEKALENYREALQLAPNTAFAYSNLAEAYIRLNRLEEAKQIAQEGLTRNLDSVPLRSALCAIAFLQGDTAALERHAEAMNTKSREGELSFLFLRGDSAAFAGKLRDARQYYEQGREAALRANLRENAADFAAFAGWMEALVGNQAEARKQTKAALGILQGGGRRSLGLCAVVSATAADLGQAQRLVAELEKRFPLDIVAQEVWLPTVRAVMETQRGNPSKAIELLKSARPYERLGWEAVYARGQAYLRTGMGREAAAEFQKILTNRGVEPFSILHPLAHLGLGRAWALAGDAAKARTSYQDFFALWKDADPDIPILRQAKAEYAKLK